MINYEEKDDYMKIGIITFHFAENYGAMLQCFALQRYFEKKGHVVEIINYRPEYHTLRYAIWLNPFKRIKLDLENCKNDISSIVKLKKVFKGQLLNIRDCILYDTKKRKRDAFLSFEQEFLNKTKEYKTLEELQNDPPQCDVYVSGSDQLWNPKLTNNQLDSSYFMNYGTDNVKRLTYAVSTCQLEVNEYSNQLKSLLSNLDGISLREGKIKNELESVSGKEISCNIDPSLLHTTEVYDEIRTCNSEKNDYLVLLLFAKDAKNKLNRVIKSIISQLNVKVLVLDTSISNMKWNVPVIKPKGVGPREYLNYIANAKYVITDSFHCTAFSIIYRKEFITLPLKGKGERMIELLNNLNLEERIATSEEDILKLVNKKIDYSMTDKYLNKEIEKTNMYFEKYI